MDLDAREVLPQDEIYRRLIIALTEKRPPPPDDWSASVLDEKVLTSGSEFEPDLLVRQRDALQTAIYYLVDFSSRMPEWIDTSENNERVKEMCRELAFEIERITVRPDEVINERGKLKSWLKAILAVNTCFIYREEAERAIARNREAKRSRQSLPSKENPLFATERAKRGKMEIIFGEKHLAKSVQRQNSNRIFRAAELVLRGKMSG